MKSGSLEKGSNRKRWLAGILVRLIWLSPVVTTLSAGTIQAQIPDDAIVGSKRLEESSKTSFQCEGVYRIKYADDSVEKCNIRFFQSGAFAGLEKRYLSKKSGREYAARVYCRGPRYSFLLEKTGMDRPFVVLFFMNSSESEPTHAFLDLDKFIYDIRTSAYTVRGKTLFDLSRSAEFVVKDIRTEQLGDRKRVFIDYRYPSPAAPDGSGTVVFDPQFDWAIVKSVSRATGTTGPIRGEWIGEEISEYDQREGRPVLKHFKYTSRTPHTVLEEHEWSLSHSTFQPISDDAFSLMAFGLKEIATEVPARESFFSLGNWLFWVCLSGAVFAFLALRITTLKLRGSQG